MDIFAEQFYADVDAETESARSRFLNSGLHPEHDRPSRQVMLSILTEELGKVFRTVNKLSILDDTDGNDDVREQLLREGYSRLVTTASVTRRFAELWRVLPRR
jgi:hypothetical protein